MGHELRALFDRLRERGFRPAVLIAQLHGTLGAYAPGGIAEVQSSAVDTALTDDLLLLIRRFRELGLEALAAALAPPSPALENDAKQALSELAKCRFKPVAGPGPSPLPELPPASLDEASLALREQLDRLELSLKSNAAPLPASDSCNVVPVDPCAAATVELQRMLDRLR